MRQRITTLALFFFIGYSTIFAQKIDTLNIYYQALKLHIDYFNNLQKTISNSEKKTSVYFIEKNDYATDSLPKLIAEHKIEILSRQEINIKTKNKKGIQLIALKPAIWDNGRLVVNVIDFEVTRKGRNYYYSNKGGSSFQVICNPNENALRLKTIHQGGF